MSPSRLLREGLLHMYLVAVVVLQVGTAVLVMLAGEVLEGAHGSAARLLVHLCQCVAFERRPALSEGTHGLVRPLSFVHVFRCHVSIINDKVHV